MKKTTISYAVATVLFASLALFNCSKKADPAPAPATTTSGTTTTGTTTSGTTTSGTTSGSTTHSTMGENTWKVNSDLYTVESSTMKVEKNNGTRTFSFSLSTNSGVNFIFKGTETLPATGIYKLVYSVPKATDEVSMLAIGSSAYYSKNELNSSILVTNTNGIITIEAVDAKASGFTGGSFTVSGKLAHDANPVISPTVRLGKGTYTIDGVKRTATVNSDINNNQITIVGSADTTMLFIIIGAPAWKDGTYRLNNSAPVDQGYGKVFLNIKSANQFRDYTNLDGGNVTISGNKVTITSLNLYGLVNDKMLKLAVTCDFTMD